MTSTADRSALASRDASGLTFIAEMYGIQLDQLAELLSLTDRQARALVRRWSGRGLAESAILGPGPAWVWLTRAGLAACGVRYSVAQPALARLAHIRAVTAVRLTLEAVPAYRDASAHWRSERHLRGRLAARARDHLPDGEVHWPDSAPVSWAGECWAIEAELTPKTVARTTAIMRGAADQDRRLRLSSCRGSGTWRAAAPRQGDLPVRPGGGQHGRARARRSRRPGRPDRDPPLTRWRAGHGVKRGGRGRRIWRAVAVLLAAVTAVGLLPVTLVTAIGVGIAWQRGWQPGRLYRAAAWCLPMLAVWAAATGARIPAAPHAVWLAVQRGDYVAAAVLVLPVATAAGLLAAGWAWSVRLRSMAARAGGRWPGAAISFDQRQWRHQVRSAQARIAAPGAVPLLTRSGDVVAGAVIRAVGHPDQPLARLPASRLRSHQIVIGGTGTGKTTLLLRLWAAFMAAGLRLHAAGQAPAPLLVVLDCKGGADARRIADRCRRVLRESGARNVAVWPDEASLSLWSLPVQQLVTTLVDLIEHGTGGAAYYADVMEAIVTLAVEAPGGPPASSADFLARLDPGWLAQAWLRDEERLALARSAARQVADIGLRFRTLFRRLGTGLDGPGSFADADAWYCVLEGTAEISVAEAQARALVDLLASYVTGGNEYSSSQHSTSQHSASQHRQVLLAVDEFSAVSRRLPIWQLYERARSLGLAVQVSAQSWHGLATREDDRYRLAGAAEGGIWLLRTPYPDPVAALAGQRSRVDSTWQLTGRLRWSRTGTSRVAPAPVADPDLIRGLDVGQAAYLYRGGVTYVQIKRLVAGPAALGPADAAATVPAAAAGTTVATAGAMTTAAGALPDVSAFLDEAFGSAR